jgi:ABC-type bacteriocin/lantibiotic exporter with double-glycine peptidase domain
MKLSVPFIRQQNDHTCGPTALQMVLQFYGRDIPDAMLCAMASTTEKSGTARKGMVRAFTLLGFKTHSHHDATLDEVKYFIEQGIPVIVNYRDFEENTGHYGVIVGLENGKVFIHDPYHTEPYLEADAIAFDARWYGYHSKKFTRWLLAASLKEIIPYEGEIMMREG